jgi:Ser/Thr protein kinase RdoA (MazF antagonist)
LAKIRENVLFLQRFVPELAPKMLEEGADRVLLTAWEGSTFNSEEAARVYPTLPWIVGAILARLDRLQSCKVGPSPLVVNKLRFLRHLARTWKSRAKIPLRIQGQFLSVVTKDLDWVLSHGDLTEWNIVVNRSRQSVALIDWEELALRPRFYDEFLLAFHRCVPIEEMTWQRALLRQRSLSELQSASEAASLQAVALACLTFLYQQEVRRLRVAAGSKEQERKSEIRRENLLWLAEASNWTSWLDGLLDHRSQAVS